MSQNDHTYDNPQWLLDTPLQLAQVTTTFQVCSGTAVKCSDDWAIWADGSDKKYRNAFKQFNNISFNNNDATDNDNDDANVRPSLKTGLKPSIKLSLKPELYID